MQRLFVNTSPDSCGCLPKPDIKVFSSVRVDVTPLSRRNVYLLKIGTKIFGDGSQDIYKDTEGNFGTICWLLRLKLSRSFIIFCFCAQRQAVNNYWFVMLSALFFFRSLFYPAKECRLNYIRKVRKRCSHSRFSSQVIILAFFLTETSACVMFMFFGCYEQLWLFLLSQAMTQGDKKFYLILVFFDFVKIVTW